MNNILVIKHGALGDLITATGAFSEIRRHFPKGQITLLTDPKYRDMACEMGYFDHVIVDQRDKNPIKMLSFCKTLKKKGYDFVFDLQNSKRTSLYYKLMGPFDQPDWSGIAPGCSHPQIRSDREFLHAAPRFADQLKVAGLELGGKDELYPDLSWMKADISRFSLKKPFALLIPGSSLSGAYKRWPATSYVTLAHWLTAKNIQPVLIAGPEDREPAEILRSRVPGLYDLSLQASLFEIGEIARKAMCVIGNDTGPTLIAAGVKAPTFILWSGASDPDVYAPRGENVQILFQEKLEDLSVERVCQQVVSFLHPEKVLNVR